MTTHIELIVIPNDDDCLGFIDYLKLIHHDR